MSSKPSSFLQILFCALRGCIIFLTCRFSKKLLPFIEANHVAVKVRMRRTSFFESCYFHTGKAQRAYYCVVALYNFSLALFVRGELRQTDSGDRFFRAFPYENFTRFLNDVLAHTNFHDEHGLAYKRQRRIGSLKTAFRKISVLENSVEKMPI